MSREKCLVVYTGDSFLIGSTFIECAENIDATIELLQLLEFTIHPKKLVLTLTKYLEFLGYIISSKQMTLTLAIRKRVKIKKICKILLSEETHTVRLVAQLLGNMSASFEVVLFGRLYHQLTEKEKIETLKKSKGNFIAVTCASQKRQI